MSAPHALLLITLLSAFTAHQEAPVPRRVPEDHLTWNAAKGVELTVELRFRVQGGPGEELGTSVSFLGDTNDDGRNEVVLGGPYLVVAASGVDGTEMWRREDGWWERGLRVVTPVGDLDRDGRPDLGVGYPAQPGNHDTIGSRAWVLSGENGSLLLEVFGDQARRGFTDLLGWDLASACDLDGDGVPDLWVGAPYGPLPDGDGRVMAISGATCETLAWTDAPAGAWFGSDLAALDDIDGDGVSDLAVVAHRGEETWVHLLSGRLLTLLHQKRLEVQGGWELITLGDLDGDGFRDLALGARTGKAASSGVVLLLSGRNADELRRLNGAGRPGGFGGAICGLPDLDGDGSPELAVSARGYRVVDTAQWYEEAGRVYVYSGGTGMPLLTITGRLAGAGFGAALASGDLEGDGDPELAIGEPEWWMGHEGSEVYRGAVHVVSLRRR